MKLKITYANGVQHITTCSLWTIYPNPSHGVLPELIVHHDGGGSEAISLKNVASIMPLVEGS